MTDTLNLGDGILMKGFKSHFDRGYLTFGAPKCKTEYHLFMWLGLFDENNPAKLCGADDRLNALGWVFDPKAAAAALNERKDAEKVA